MQKAYVSNTSNGRCYLLSGQYAIASRINYQKTGSSRVFFPGNNVTKKKKT